MTTHSMNYLTIFSVVFIIFNYYLTVIEAHSKTNNAGKTSSDASVLKVGLPSLLLTEESRQSHSGSSQLTAREYQTGEEIDWEVISCGGNKAASTNFTLSGSVGQTAVGIGASTNFKVNQGFWQDFGSIGSCCNLAGDANNNGIRNILDVTYTIAFLYKSGPPHPDCHPDEMDVSGNGVVNILDVTYMIAFLYKSGPVPICP